MLKKIISLLLVSLVLFSCLNKNETRNEENIKAHSILSPNGSPALALLDFIDDKDYELDFVDGSDVLQSELSKGEKDFIIAPINLGYKLSQQTNNYELKAVISWGNLYIIGNTDKDIMKGKIAAFGEAAVPGKIISLVSKDGYLSSDITWFPSVADASTAFLSGEFDYAVVAEPYLTNLQFKNGDFKVIASIQDLYSKVTSQDSYPQAALFVKKSLIDNNDECIDVVTNKIKNSIELYTNNPDKLDNKLANVDLSIMGFNNPKIIQNSYTSLGLKYVDKYDCQNEIAYLLKLFDIDYK